MKVLVLGGTGAMGVHLVKLLADKNIETFVTSRSAILSEENITYIQGNAIELDFLHSLLKERWDAIVDFMVYTTPIFKQRMGAFLNATDQYVFISTARVYAETKNLITENSTRLIETSKDKTFLATDEYSLTKARQENLLMESGRKNWTIIRPYITYSSDRLQLGVLEKEDWLYRALKGRTIVFSEDIFTKRSTITFGLDVSKGIADIIGKRNAIAQSFHITNNTSNTWEEVLNVYLSVLEKHLGKRPKVLLQNLNDFFEHHPEKYQVYYDRMYNREFDNTKISEFTNPEKFTKIEEGLKNCIEDFTKKPSYKNIYWRKEALRDRKTKEHTSLTEISGTKNKIRYLVFRYLKNINF
ncbi:SDR family oxidoreductase [Algibacter mikhailovii]|uniref:SDR family oxidoreductase n=1 Tax=Algibacter mikhailovii TaxID=425498 RepID=UPI00249563D6|nr:SDR family oxidoreductase [Algibacter mikhailovii]